MYYTIYVAPWLAILFWLAFVLNIMAKPTGRFMIASVALNGALFWTANVIARVFYGYVGPGAFFSTWGIFFYMHTGLSLIAMASVIGAYNATVYARLAPLRRRLARFAGHPHAAKASP